jgi:hypothetical protein
MANQCGPARGSRMRQARPLDVKPALAVLKRSTTCTGVRAVGNSVPLFLPSSLSVSLVHPPPAIRGGLNTSAKCQTLSWSCSPAAFGPWNPTPRHAVVVIAQGLPITDRDLGAAATVAPLEDRHHHDRTEDAPFDAAPRIPCRTDNSPGEDRGIPALQVILAHTSLSGDNGPDGRRRGRGRGR